MLKKRLSELSAMYSEIINALAVLFMTLPTLIFYSNQLAPIWTYTRKVCILIQCPEKHQISDSTAKLKNEIDKEESYCFIAVAKAMVAQNTVQVSCKRPLRRKGKTEREKMCYSKCSLNNLLFFRSFSFIACFPFHDSLGRCLLSIDLYTRRLQCKYYCSPFTVYLGNC